MKIPAQRGVIIILPHPVEEGFSPLALALVVQEERVEDAGPGLPDMAEAPGELAQRLARGAALEQHEQPGRKAGTVRARLAVQQRRRAHVAVDAVQPQDAVALWRPAA